MDDLRLGDVLTCYHPFHDGRFLVVSRTRYKHQSTPANVSYVTCVRLSADVFDFDGDDGVGQTRKMHDVDVNFAIKKGWLRVELP